MIKFNVDIPQFNLMACTQSALHHYTVNLLESDIEHAMTYSLGEDKDISQGLYKHEKREYDYFRVSTSFTRNSLVGKYRFAWYKVDTCLNSHSLNTVEGEKHDATLGESAGLAYNLYYYRRPIFCIRDAETEIMSYFTDGHLLPSIKALICYLINSSNRSEFSLNVKAESAYEMIHAGLLDKELEKLENDIFEDIKRKNW